MRCEMLRNIGLGIAVAVVIGVLWLRQRLCPDPLVEADRLAR